MKKWVSVNLLQESSRRTRVTKRRGEHRSSIDYDDGTCLYIICGRHLPLLFFRPFHFFILLSIFMYLFIRWDPLDYIFFFLIGTVFLHSLSLIKALHNGRLIWVGPRGLQTVAVVNCDGLTVAHKSQTFLWAYCIYQFLNARPLSVIFCNLIIN